MTPVQGPATAAVPRAAADPFRSGVGSRDRNSATSFGDLYRTHVGERPGEIAGEIAGDRRIGSVGRAAGNGTARADRAVAGPAVDRDAGHGAGRGAGIAAGRRPESDADRADRAAPDARADRAVPDAATAPAPHASPAAASSTVGGGSTPQATDASPGTADTGVTPAFGNDPSAYGSTASPAQGVTGTVAAAAPTGAESQAALVAGARTDLSAASAHRTASAGSEAGTGTAVTPSGTGTGTGADSTSSGTVPAVAPSSTTTTTGTATVATALGAEAGVTPSGSGADATLSGTGTGTGTVMGAGTGTALSSGAADSAGAGTATAVQAAPPVQVGSAGSAVPAGGPVPGSVPEATPAEATPSGAGADGVSDAVAPDAPVAPATGMQGTAEPGTPTPSSDATTGQLGADPQPASGRVDLPAPTHPVSAGTVVGSSDPTAAVPARPAAIPLPQQLGGHAFALARTAADAPGGTSTITVTVAPDDLGPITIRASFTADGTRLEFFSSTDSGRDALRQAIPDLRREASSSGLSASLDLGSGTPDDHRDGLRDEPRRSTTTTTTTAREPVQGTAWTRSPAAGSSTLDLFA